MSFIPPSNFGLVVDYIYRSASPIELNYPFLEQLHLKTVIYLSNKPPKRSFKTFIQDQQIKLKHYGKSQMRTTNNMNMNIANTNNMNNNSNNNLNNSSNNNLNNNSSSSSSTSSSNNNINNLNRGKPLNTIGNINNNNNNNNISSSNINSTSNIGNNSSLSLSSLNSSLPTMIGDSNDFSYSSSSHSHSVPSLPWQSMSEDSIIAALKLILNPSCAPLLICCHRGGDYTGLIVACLRKLQRWNLASIFAEYRRFTGNRSKPMNEQFIELFDTDLIAIPDPAPQWFEPALQFYVSNAQQMPSMQPRTRTPVSQLKRADRATGGIGISTGAESHQQTSREKSLSTANQEEAAAALPQPSSLSRGTSSVTNSINNCPTPTTIANETNNNSVTPIN